MLGDSIVTLEPKAHRYFNQHGREYTSVSKVLETVKNKFDENGRIKMFTAKKYGISQGELQAAWDKTKNDACDHGTRIHNALERYENEFVILDEDKDLEFLVKSVANLFSGYGKNYQEFVLHSDEYGVAGTCDKMCSWTTRGDSIVDFYDYKTNVSKGIQFDNDRKEFLKAPLDHLMDCNYNIYSLQLSIYAYLFELATSRKIGKLNIIFIPPDDFIQWRLIPVPYMKMEAKALLDHFYSLPKVVEIVVPEAKGFEGYEIVNYDQPAF